jgi:hypothetical protein
MVLLACLVYAGSWAVSQANKIRDGSAVAIVAEKTKAVCVGRYLVDVPVQAEVELSGGVMDGFDIDTVEEIDAGFRERIGARQAGIEASRTDAASDAEGRMVEARDLGVPAMVGRTFIYGHSRGYLIEGGRRVWPESVSIESHAHIQGVSVSLTAKSADQASARQAEALLARLQIRAEDEVPTVPTGMGARAGGKPIDSSLREDALLALWDGIASSIRVRGTVGRPASGPRRTASNQEARQLAAH